MESFLLGISLLIFIIIVAILIPVWSEYGFIIKEALLLRFLEDKHSIIITTLIYMLHLFLIFIVIFIFYLLFI